MPVPVRLTSALRAIAADDSPDPNVVQAWPADLLARKRRRQEERKQDINNPVSLWPQLVAELQLNIPESRKLVREFRTGVTKLINDVLDDEALEGAAATVYSILQNPVELTEQVKRRHSTELRKSFGYLDKSVLESLYPLVHKIRSWQESTKFSVLPETSHTQSKPFGDKIPFVFDTLQPDEIGQGPPTMNVSATVFQQRHVVPAAPVSSNSGTVDNMWLKRKCEEHFPAAASDMCLAIFELLSSGKEDGDLQTGLFDLVGFERFDFIQEVLEHRNAIVALAMDNMYLGSSRATSIADTGPVDQYQPAIAGQVTIQSKREKEIRKALKKEEKKRARSQAQETSDKQACLAALGFDPDRLRKAREKALADAKNAPLFSDPNPRRYTGKQEKYPYVFDSLAEGRNRAFVSNSRLLLPKDCEREDNKMFERVMLPARAPAAQRSFERLVHITELSPIGQMVFPYKTLNRIQSVVYETAYHTNENMLVCAPTGAGKTNIAMLCVLHTIEQYVINGKIEKDKFKIVYVAPMKALAAEMVRSFGTRLKPLGISVKELTGDMQLTKTEIMQTNMLVTTPEKWDVVTRKTSGDVSLVQLVKLLILDEVHLLHDDRGAVIESLVARTLRQVESSQSMIRILGLSATLPNYVDAARFLRVNPYLGLFFFDGAFRPVPLQQTFVGVKAKNPFQQQDQMNTVCYDEVIKHVRNGDQVMVFVHSRNSTGTTALKLRDLAIENATRKLFSPQDDIQYGQMVKNMSKSRNKQLRDLFPDGFAIHHAGMLRSDRQLVERYFADGLIKVLCCTATLAWGVNLPAHAVIIKGTQLYDAKHGAFIDLGILDVQQIFGRAGRPQFDTCGEAVLVTSHDKLSHYLNRMTNSLPIESQFIPHLSNNLNAEIALGTVTNVDEAVEWLGYSFLYVRMRRNPLAYGIKQEEKELDPELRNYRRKLVVDCARKLDEAKMIRFEERNGYLHITELGRVASHFYVKYDSIEVFNDMFRPSMTEADIFSMVSMSKEFDNIKVRDDEMDELDDLLQNCCQLFPVKGGVENAHGKVNILLQTYICRERPHSFSLVSDMAYVAQNSARIFRALFEIAIRRNWPSMSRKLITYCKSIDKRLWPFVSPLRQFPHIKPEILAKIDEKKLTVEKMQDMEANDIGHLVRHVRMGTKIKELVGEFPTVQLHATIQPITRTVVKITLVIEPKFNWSMKIHGKSEPWWIWVEDADNEHIYHAELYQMRAEHVRSRDETERNQTLIFTIPIFEPLPAQYYVRAMSDRWLGAEAMATLSFKNLVLPQQHPPHTSLLDLQPLPLTCLKTERERKLFKFSHFNPVQTQMFHEIYHTDDNILLGAPTGSGKTVAADLSILRMLREHPGTKAVYIAPLKALVKERIQDWKERFGKILGKSVLELTGDVTPDMHAIRKADIIVTTPEKWDGISRSWQTRSYVQAVSTVIIDEIHMLGADRGPVLEVIISRLNYISSHTTHKVRIVGLSTALANAHDLANWLGIEQQALFNFKPSVRPVPLRYHVQGFPGQHYCPRMKTMNKPTYQAIKTHSFDQPALVFVSSRRQTRLTALDLISFCATEDDPKQFLRMPEREVEAIISGIKDTNLKLTLSFGIGLHHAGLHEQDRKVCETLFKSQKIQVLVATATLAWGVNLPAHLVVVKGTEFFDGKTKRYVDFDITDVLQMSGRAGRPQYDEEGVAVVLCQDIKKHFYKKFMHEPFPVESNLHKVLENHFNAEIVAGTITTVQEVVDYLTWTFFFRRLVMNPSYYGLEDVDETSVNEYLSELVEHALDELADSHCLSVDVDGVTLQPSIFGRITSFYYLNHHTMRMFLREIKDNMDILQILEVLTDASEFEELPVRHNEDLLNEELQKFCPISVENRGFESPHSKCHLLIQAHLSHIKLPIADYKTDTKSVMDQCIRVLQAMIDVSADCGYLSTSLQTMHLTQMIVQGRWFDDSTLYTLPHMTEQLIQSLAALKPAVECLPELMDMAKRNNGRLRSILSKSFPKSATDQMMDVIDVLPVINMKTEIKGVQDGESLIAGEEYALRVELNRNSRVPKSTHSQGTAIAPGYPKPKEEGWWLVLGMVESNEVIALKRLPCVRGKMSSSLAFTAPEQAGISKLTAYLMSDSYLGLDQQYDIELHVRDASNT